MAEGDKMMDSTSTTCNATDRQRLYDDDLRLSATQSVLSGGGGGPSAGRDLSLPLHSLEQALFRGPGRLCTREKKEQANAHGRHCGLIMSPDPAVRLWPDPIAAVPKESRA